jgi:hypothetical protein
LVCHQCNTSGLCMDCFMAKNESKIIDYYEKDKHKVIA